MSEHKFGGDWTEDKLDRLRKYLPAYTKILTRNTNAQYFSTIYIDAFAGSGYRTERNRNAEESSYDDGDLIYADDPYRYGEAEAALAGDLEESDILRTSAENRFLDGSAHIALKTEPPFDKYIFIEQNSKRADALKFLKHEFPSRAGAIEIVNDDANRFLQDYCARTEMWRKWRAVVFLDPYGLQVEWKTLEAIAQTKAIDLWILVPIGIGVCRNLPRKKPPPPEWAKRITTFFGTDEWQKFYVSKSEVAKPVTPSLFEIDSNTELVPEESLVRDADFADIGDFFVRRLETIFNL